MFKQDNIMRLIKEMVRAILKLLFHIDTESPTSELIEDEKEKVALEALLDMVDEGFICKAENIVFEMIDAGDRKKLELVLLFYSYLNDKSDEFLEQNNFSRRQLQDNLKYIMTQYGLGSIAETFLL